MKRIKLLTLTSLLMAAFFALNAHSATFVVNTTVDANDVAAGNGICEATAGVGDCTLRAAISEANALVGADIITLPAGTYTTTIADTSENVNANGDLDITSDITINGAGAASTIVEANVAPGVALARVFHIRGLMSANTIVATLDGMTIRHGRYANNTFGGGIRIDQGTNHNVTLSNLIVTQNLNSSSGGGISISGTTNPTVSISNSTITANGAGSAVAGTSANGAGVHINTVATVSITNSTISNNASNNAIASSTASVFGAGVFIGGGSGLANTTITDTTISGNSSAVTGAGATGLAFAGGIYNQQAILNMSNSSITGNTAGFHNGLRNLAGTIAATATLTNCQISNNIASVEGGGITNVIGGTATASATVNLIDSTVSGNAATSNQGGGILNFSTSTSGAANATVNVTNSTVSGNTSAFGGGIMNQSAAATAVGPAVVTLNRSTVSGNIATGNGGGIYNISFSTGAGVATVNSTNSTLSGNRGASGGAITNENGTGAMGATSNLNYTTVASNTATASGGGLNNTGTAINVKNSVVADNTAATSGPDIFGTITSQDYNHVEDVTGGTFLVDNAGKFGGVKGDPIVVTSFMPLPNDVTGSDPLLGALANNGGSTQTHLPASLSPVVNTIPSGTSDCGTTVTTSQNAVTRPASTGCEKGSAELTPTAGPADISGRVTTADGRPIKNVVVSVSGSGLPEPITILTNQFGRYSFDDLPSGQLYVVSVSSKRFAFSNSTRVINLEDDFLGADFIADGSGGFLRPAGVKPEK